MSEISEKIIKHPPKARGLVKVLCMVRAIIGGPFAALYTGVHAFIGIILVNISNSQKLSDFIVFTWVDVLCRIFNVHIRVTGLEKLPKEGVIFIFNHSSHYDIPIFHNAIPKSARFGAKIELYKIPIFGRSLTAMGALPIARGDRDKVIDVYRRSIPLVKQGRSFILAAEGTRLAHEGVGEKLKAGPFLFAIEAQCPIVPVVIHGASKIVPKGSLLAGKDYWTHLAQVQVLDPISTVGMTQEDRGQLLEKAKSAMHKAYNQLAASMID